MEERTDGKCLFIHKNDKAKPFVEMMDSDDEGGESTVLTSITNGNALIDDVRENCDEIGECDSNEASCISTCGQDLCGYQLVILFSSFMCYFIFCGICYNVGLYYVAWIDEFQAGGGITSWLGSVHIGLICAIGPISGLLVDRFSFRSVTIAGGILTTVGLVATAYADSIYTLLLTFSIITPFGIGLVYVPSSTIVSLWFVKGRVLANGIFTSGAGLGNFVMAYVLQHSIDTFQWRGSMFISAASALHLCLLGALMREPESWIQMKKAQKLRKGNGLEVSGFHIYRSSGMVLYLIQNIMCAAGFSIVYVHVTAITESLAKVSRLKATLAISMIGLSSIFGRLSSGFLGQHKNVDTFLFFILCMTISGISAILVPFLSYYACIITWSVLFGFVSAPFIALQQIMILKFVDLSDLNSAFAHSAVSISIGYIMGAPLAGWLFDYTQDYSGSFFLGGAFITSGTLLLIFPYVRHRRELKLKPLQLASAVKATSFGSMLGSQYLSAIRSHDEERFGGSACGSPLQKMGQKGTNSNNSHDSLRSPYLTHLSQQHKPNPGSPCGSPYSTRLNSGSCNVRASP